MLTDTADLSLTRLETGTAFRDLEEETNDAIALFGNRDARGIVLLKPYASYYDEYAEKR